MEKPRKWLRQCLWLAISFVVLFSGIRLYYKLTDDFRISNIIYEMPYHAEWSSSPLIPSEQAHIDSILKQKFYYLGKGAQSYAFASEDQLYVLKFFKFKHLKPSWFIQSLPNIPPFTSLKERETTRKFRKLNSIFTGYKLAYDLEKEESALLYIQLNPSNVKRNVILFDKIGLERTVDLGSVVFILQKKGLPLDTVLKDLLDKGDLTLAKERIGQIFDLYMSEYRKGIYDLDHGVLHNRGFIGNKPFLLDVGKLRKDERTSQPDFIRNDLSIVVSRILPWLQKKYPKQAPELEQYMEQKLTEILGSVQ